jgi:aspartate racemase
MFGRGRSPCYRTICAEGAGLLGAHAHPEVSMHTPSFPTTSLPRSRDWQGVGELMLTSARKLARRGRLPDLPGQYDSPGLPFVEPRSRSVAAHRRSRCDGAADRDSSVLA